MSEDAATNMLVQDEAMSNADTNSSTIFVWIQGWAMPASIWDGMKQGLSGTHLHADFSWCSSTDDLQREVDQLLDCAGDESGQGSKKLIVVGWSLGAMLAMNSKHLTASNAQQLKVLWIAPSLQFVSSDPSLGWSDGVLRRMQRKLKTDASKVVDQFTHQLFAPQESRHSLAPHDFSVEGLIAGLELLRTLDLHHHWTNNIQHIPGIWVHGEQDVICPIAAVPSNVRTSHADRSCQFHMLQKGGHALMLTQESTISSLLHSLVTGESP